MQGERRGRIGSEVRDRVREATDIVEVVGQYVNLKRSGRNLKGLCPFHAEKSPSFMVHPERQMYHCFGCHKGGDVFSFLMEHDGVSFMEAMRALGERAGIPVEVRTEGGANDALYAAAERAAVFFESKLREAGGESVRQYVQKRGLRPELVESFRLGAAANSWDALGRALAAEGIGEESLVALGLVQRRPRGSGIYDTFRNRLVFPIRSLSGRVVGFGGRILPGPDEAQAPKYLNSADSPIYHKNQLLYGLAESRAAIRRADAVILTEGYLDYLSLYQAGIEHVVAACGTAFGPQQAALLHRYTRRAYILGDNDPAGQRAAVRSAGLLLEQGFLVYVVELPRGYDPDAFVREHGSAALETRLHEAPSYIAYMKLLVDRRAGDLAVKERVVRHLLDDLSRVGDSLMQELYRKELCRSFALSDSAISAALEQRKAGGRPARAAATVSSASESGSMRTAVREAERGLLRLGLAGSTWAERLSRALEPEDFDAGPGWVLFEALCPAPGQAAGAWLDRLDAEEDRSFATQLALEELPLGEPERLFGDYVAALKTARLEAAELDLQRRLAEAAGRGDRDSEDRLILEQRALAQERNQLRKRGIEAEPRLPRMQE
jgi:DNA primase